VLARIGRLLHDRIALTLGAGVRHDRLAWDKWVKQVARQLTDALDGFARGKTHLIIDRDTKYCSGFRQILESAGIQIVLCPRIPQCNAIAQRFVRSIKTECMDRLIVLGEEHLRAALRSYETHYNQHRNHQGMDNQLLTPQALPVEGRIRCQHRLLNHYYREAA
jgi:transposase InsO family protein